MIPAVGYCRFSSERQRDSYSIEAQKYAILEYANANGYKILTWYVDEAQSAKSADRPAFQDMISDSKGAKKFEAVIVHKLDRFSRDTFDAMLYRNKLKENGVSLVSVLERLDDSAESNMVATIIMGVNQFYVDNLARETKKGQHQACLDGKFMSRTPYGYNKVEGKLVINDDQAKNVLKAFKMRSVGATFREITNYLNVVELDTIFTPQSVKKLLNNTIYRGDLVYGKDSQGEPRLYPNHSPSIVSHELWYDANNKVVPSGRKVLPQEDEAFNYALSGKTFCSECGAPYVGKTKKYKKDDGTYSFYRRFMCRNREPQTPNQQLCNSKSLNYLNLESEIVLEIRRIFFTEELIEKILKYITDAFEDDIKRIKKNKDSIARAYNKKEKEKARLLDLYLDETFSKEDYIEKRKQIEEELKSLKMDLALAENETPRSYDKGKFLKLARSHLMPNKIKPNRARDRELLIYSFVDKVLIDKNGKIKIEYKVDLRGLVRHLNQLSPLKFTISAEYELHGKQSGRALILTKPIEITAC